MSEFIKEREILNEFITGGYDFKKGVLYDGGKDTHAVLHIGSPHDFLITGSGDSVIRVFNRKTGECLKVLKNHRLRVRQIIRWNKLSILSCSSDKRILSFSLPDFNLIRSFEMNNSNVVQIEKLDHDRFVSSNFRDELLIISYSRNEVITKLRPEIGYRKRTRLIKSRTFENCFYMNTNDTLKTVKLINYEKGDHGKIEKSIVLKRNSLALKDSIPSLIQVVYSISIFINKETNEEMLVVGGGDGNVFIYNLGKSLAEKMIKCVKKIPTDGPRISSTRIVGERYCLICNSLGWMKVYDMKNCCFLINKYLYGKEQTVNDIVISEDRNPDYLEVFTATYSSRSWMIYGLNLYSYSFEKEDYQERIDFLRSETKKIGKGKKKKTPIGRPGRGLYS